MVYNIIMPTPQKRTAEQISERRSRYQRLRLYGLTHEQYLDLCKLQNDCCAICGRYKKLVVDHDHTTGEVRGLLCKACNIGLGYFRENLFSLRGAIDYLISPPAKGSTKK